MFTSQVQEAMRNMYKGSGPDNIVLFGIESHVCILQTALELLENGYKVHVLADGVSSINVLECKIALQSMREAGATISTSESVLFRIMQDATHDRFKSVQAIIKKSKDATKEAVSVLLSNL